MKRSILITALLASLLLAASLVLAGPDDLAYAIPRWSLDGGGVTGRAGGDYVLSGTAGQPDAQLWSGGDYVLAGGLWGGTAGEFHLYLPLVLKGS